MMRLSVVFGLLLAMLWSLAEAQTLRYRGHDLQVSDQARACYLVFVKLYDAAYYRDDSGKLRCVRLDYLRGFSREELVEATQQIFATLHGDDALREQRAQLQPFLEGYMAVQPGDTYQYCVDRTQGGEMLRDGMVVASIDDPDFGERFLNIWVTGEQQGRPQWNFSRCPGTVF